MQKKVFFGILTLMLILISGFFAVKTQAGISNNASGWAWGGSTAADGTSTGLGWISMNSTDCDTNNNNFVDTGVCGGLDNATTPVVDYGVNIPLADGNLSGYAWSSNYGYISFNEADVVGCPGGGTCASRRSVNNILGWARILGIKNGFEAVPSNSGGWEGWIKLSSVAGDPVAYGITFNADGKTITKSPTTSYAWSNEAGFIDFYRVSLTVPLTLTADLTAAPNYGTAPVPSILTATAGGTAAGPYKYEFDCTNDGTYEATFSNVAGAIQATPACIYNSSGVARVKITSSSGISAEDTAIIGIITCGNGSIDPGETCDSGVGNNGQPCPETCDGSCQIKTCNKSGNWKEVAP